MGCLYSLSFPNGKAYIGITSGTAEARLSEHLYNASSSRGRYALHRAIRKYSVATLTTLAVADDWAYLCDLERRAIAAYGTFGRGGYNMTAGGEGALGYRPTAEARKRMSAVHKGKAHHAMPHSAAAKAKMSAARKGRKLAPEHAANIAASLMGNKYSLGFKQSQASIDKRNAAIRRGARGISWCTQTGKWRAYIAVDGKTKDLGRYADEAEALTVRAAALQAYIAGGAA